MNTIGIVAGSGALPLEMLEAARAEGLQVHVGAVKNEADPLLAEKADSCDWVRVGELDKLIRYFRSKKVEAVVFGGKIQKTNLLRGEVRPDLTMIRLFAQIKRRNDDTLLGTIADHMTKKGLTVLDSTRFLKDSLPASGILSARKPSRQEMENIQFGFLMAKGIAGLDIGQTVVVKDMSVVAVESVEGTDECIRRGGHLGGPGSIVIKVAKPAQDMRFDVPAVGLDTLEAMREVKAAVLAFEAKKTIVVEREAFLKKADQLKIAVIAYEPKKN